MVQSLKIEKVKETFERLNRSQAVVLVDYRGLTVQEINRLRVQLRENDGELKVIKNRLTKRALADAECESLDDLLAGPIALA